MCWFDWFDWFEVCARVINNSCGHSSVTTLTSGDLWPQVTSVQHAVRIKFDWLTAYINVMFPVAGLRWQWCERMTAVWRWRAAGLKLKRSDWTFPPSRWANTCRDTHYVTAATLQQQFVLQSQLKERDGEMNTHTSLSTLQGVAKQPKEIWNQNSDVKKINRM